MAWESTTRQILKAFEGRERILLDAMLEQMGHHALAVDALEAALDQIHKEAADRHVVLFADAGLNRILGEHKLAARPHRAALGSLDHPMK